MKKRGVAIACLAALLLSGCGDVMPNLTEEENNVIGEYAAIQLLRYDVSTRSRLVDPDLLQDEPEPVQPVEPQNPPEEENPPESQMPETPVKDNTAAAVTESPESLLELPEGMSLIYTGYETDSVYQEDGNSYFVLEAAEGKELLILHFSLQNAADVPRTVDLFGNSTVYRVTVNGDYTRAALMTMLSNDLVTYSGTVPAAGAADVVLVVEVESGIMESAESIILNMKKDSRTCVMQLL